MIQLCHSTLIDAPPERVWAWLNGLPEHYRQWHSAHVACRYERGTSLQVGTILYVEEYLHGRLHRLHLRATEVVPERLLRYRTRSFQGAFLIEPANGGTRFTAELAFGLPLPGLGRVLDLVLSPLFRRRLAALQAHMREEGAALKRLLEPDSRRLTTASS